MFLGYVLNDTSFPLLQQITEDQLKDLTGDKPTLIVGYSKAIQLFGKKVNLNTRIVDKKKQIYYSFSRNESEENYLEQTTKFLKRTLAARTSNILVTNIIDPNRIDIAELKGQKVFLHETSKLITISTKKQIYFFNKEISLFFNEEALTTDFLTELLKDCEVWSWDRFKYFGARLKSNFCYKSKDQLRYLLEPYQDVELYMGVFCLQWLDEIPENEHEEVWQRAYEVEDYLSSLPIKIDKKAVLLSSYASESTLFENLLKQHENGYVYQQYNGTDKTTGRMYSKGSGYSIQTLSENIRHIVIAEPECYLVEFDYKYFEYSLLRQICGIPVKGDPHKLLAIEFFGDESHRGAAKIINYGAIYGKSISTLVEELIQIPNVNYNEEELTKRLGEIMKPFVKFRKKLTTELNENGYVVNPFGRQIVPEKDFAVLNNYIQSTAADLLIRKLLKIRDFLKTTDILNRVILQKHDSILFNLRTLDIDETDIALDLKKILETPECNLYGKVSLKYGVNWRDLED